ncbi:MAG: hypothetical protein IJF94_00645 [Eubacterium sp.]|nr:hypothetical protein [Eubacterium sp.]
MSNSRVLRIIGAVAIILSGLINFVSRVVRFLGIFTDVTPGFWAVFSHIILPLLLFAACVYFGVILIASDDMMLTFSGVIAVATVEFITFLYACFTDFRFYWLSILSILITTIIMLAIILFVMYISFAAFKINVPSGFIRFGFILPTAIMALIAVVSFIFNIFWVFVVFPSDVGLILSREIGFYIATFFVDVIFAVAMFTIGASIADRNDK